MRSLRIAVLVLITAANSARALTLLPLETEDPALLPPGKLEISLGAHYLDSVQPVFRDVERNQWSAPELGISAGLGSRAEAQLRWEAIAARDVSPGSQFSRFDTGDARLFTKVRVTSAGDFARPWVPETALQFGLKLPNASFRGGLGTDEADFFGHFLAAEDVLGARILTDVGVAILGNPGSTRGQDDLFLYGVAALSPSLAQWRETKLTLLGEISGSEGSRFENDRRRARLGLRIGTEWLAGYAGMSAPLTSRNEDFGVRFGLVWWLQVFSEP